jgi:peptidoglycan-N-acetylglucosamine deacetylase
MPSNSFSSKIHIATVKGFGNSTTQVFALLLKNLKAPLQNLNLTLPSVRKYLVKTPRLLKVTFSSCIWHIKQHANSVYLTFDDGPHPIITPIVLAQLKKYNAKATFFCIGKNVEAYPEIYAQILADGHAVGNHTQNHYNGWKVSKEDYLQNIIEAQKHIDSKLFRPPYGRITASQIKGLAATNPLTRVILWDVLSGDFDENISGEKCLKYAISGTAPGSIIVFHDSEKAFKRLEYALPRFLAHCQQKGWAMKKINYT